VPVSKLNLTIRSISLQADECDKKSKYVVEIQRLFHIAVPLMGAQLAQMGMGVSDEIMTGQYSSADLAGAALSGCLLWPVMLIIMGLI
jgi:MATE family multidrug resistance protein